MINIVKDISISYDGLIRNQVSIIFKRLNGGEYNKGYQNSNNDRLRLNQDCTDDIYNEVIKTWGDTPTVEDYVPEALPEPEPPPPTPEQLAIAELSIAQAMAQQQNEMAIAELSIMIAGGI